MLDERKQIEDLLVVKNKSPVMTNPLFLQFCLWNLKCGGEYFNLQNGSQAYELLKDMCLQCINNIVLGSSYAKRYPALNIHSALPAKNDLHLSFLRDILANCDKINTIRAESPATLDWVLFSMHSMLQNINFIECNKTEMALSYCHEKQVVVTLENKYSTGLDILLKHAKSNGLFVHLYTKNPPEPLSETYSTCLALHVEYNRKEQTFMKYWRHHDLTHLSLTQCFGYQGKIDSIFMKQLFPKLKHLNLLKTELEETDLRALCLACNSEKTLPKLSSLCISIPDHMSTESMETSIFLLPWLNLKCFYLHYIPKSCPKINVYECLRNAQKDKKLPILKSLRIHQKMHHEDSSLQIEPDEHLKSNGAQSDLRGLALPSLLALVDWPIETLILNNCGLNSRDLSYLAQSSICGRLPRLRYLDLSENAMISSDFKCLFDNSCRWDQLLTLNIMGTLLSKVDNFVTLVETYSLLGSLLEIEMASFPNVTKQWIHLKAISLPHFIEGSVRNITAAVDQGFLPSLRTIRVVEFSTYDTELIQSLSKRKIDCHKICVPFDDPFNASKHFCRIK